MTLQAKIKRYLRERTAQAGGRPARTPPISRVLWALRLDVPPPAYWPAWVWVVAYVVATVAFCWVARSVAHPYCHIGPARGAFLGIMLGVFYAYLKVASYRQLVLSPWYGTPEGNT